MSTSVAHSLVLFMVCWTIFLGAYGIHQYKEGFNHGIEVTIEDQRELCELRGKDNE